MAYTVGHKEHASAGGVKMAIVDLTRWANKFGTEEAPREKPPWVGMITSSPLGPKPCPLPFLLISLLEGVCTYLVPGNNATPPHHLNTPICLVDVLAASFYDMVIVFPYLYPGDQLGAHCSRRLTTIVGCVVLPIPGVAALTAPTDKGYAGVCARNSKHLHATRRSLRGLHI